MKCIHHLLSIGLFYSLCLAAKGQTAANTDKPCFNYTDQTECGQGNSFNPATGNEFREIKDLEVWGGTGAMPLVWRRYANSRFGSINGSYGNAHFWTSSFMYRMFDDGINTSGQPNITIISPNGDRNRFTQTKTDPTIWLPRSFVQKRLFQNGNNFILQMADGYRYHFEKLLDNSGNNFYRLQFFLDPYQNKYTLSYTNDNRLTRVTEPAGRYLQITYTKFNRKSVITQVSASDGRYVRYHYKEFPDSTINWVALDTVFYEDGTKAVYNYTQSEAGAHPMLLHAIDPRVVGPATNIIYSYDTDIAPGYFRDERNGVTGEVMATLFVGETENTVCFANGATRVFEVPLSLRGRARKYTDGIGGQTRYQYHNGGLGFLKSSTDALGRTTTYDSVSIYGSSIHVTHPDGSTESWTRDELDLVLTHTDELGRITTYTRDNKHRVKRMDYPDGTFETFTYNNFGQVLTHRLKNKGVEKFEYNYRGLTTSFTDALANVTRYGYDGSDRLARITDANGHTTQFAYNPRGLLTKQTNADGTSQKFAYDSIGNRTKTTNELGHTTTKKFDEFKRMVSSTDALNRSTKYSYGLPGGTCGCAHTEATPTKITMPSGKMITIDYDLEWRKLSQTEGSGTADAATTFYEYDIAGRLVSIIDPRGKEWKTGYDKRDRRKASADPLGNTTQWDYDVVGNVVAAIRPDGGITTHKYDAMNRDTLTTDPKGQIVRMRYDAEGNLAALIDPRGQVYSFRHDLLNRKTKMTYPDGLYESFAYDVVGNLKTYRVRAGQVRTYLYDSRNRDTSSFWTSPYKDDVTPAIYKRYDDAGRLKTTISSVSRLTYTYSKANELLSETQDIAGGPGPKTVGYTYDKDGQRKTITYPDGRILNYTYTNRNKIAGISSEGSDLVKYTYDLNSNRTCKVLENGTTAVYTYDAANRILSIDNSKGTTSFARFDYGYDNVDRRTFVKRNKSKGDVFRYDAIDQVTNVLYEATNPETTNPLNAVRTVSYNWDSSGNREVVVDNETPTDYTINNMNQYTGVGTDKPTYFRNGNMWTFDGWTYLYYAQSRMKSASKGTTATSFAYDGLNRYVKRTINGKTTFFYYDGWSLIEERSSNSALLSSYVHGVMIDELLIKVSDSTVVYYHQDALGSTTHLTDIVGNVIEQYSYDVFGAPTIKKGSGTIIAASSYGNRFLFTGREYIQELSLYDYRNRMYSLQLGRFLQNDPIRFDADDYNLYRYVENNPINRTDFNGLGSVAECDDALDNDLAHIERVRIDCRIACGESWCCAQWCDVKATFKEGVARAQYFACLISPF